MLVFDPEGKHTRCTFHTLRQQTKKPAGQHNLALADFVREPVIPGYPPTMLVPSRSRQDSVSTNASLRSNADHDDYSAILLKALADRLAEAFC